MVLASHVIFTMYGFWLPNDPRGSWSDFVRSWDLLQFGRATKVHTRRSLAREPHNAALRAAAKRALQYPSVRINGEQALLVARGFEEEVDRCGYRVYACSILPTHVHLVIARHHYAVEQVANRLKGNATRVLVREGKHPFMDHQDDDGSVPCMWTSRPWKVFLDSDEAIVRAIRYVEENPLKDGKRAQRWRFVTPFTLG